MCFIQAHQLGDSENSSITDIVPTAPGVLTETTTHQFSAASLFAFFTPLYLFPLGPPLPPKFFFFFFFCSSPCGYTSILGAFLILLSPGMYRASTLSPTFSEFCSMYDL